MEQLLGRGTGVHKTNEAGFNSGACLEVVFMQHGEDIFRGDYELSQSVS